MTVTKKSTEIKEGFDNPDGNLIKTQNENETSWISRNKDTIISCVITGVGTIALAVVGAVIKSKVENQLSREGFEEDTD